MFACKGLKPHNAIKVFEYNFRSGRVLEVLDIPISEEEVNKIVDIQFVITSRA